MQDRRRSSIASSLPGSLTETALNLPLDARRDLTQALLWSLPREDIIALSLDLSRLLQKDILGQLPSEVSVIILSHLTLEDILKCRLVSRDWAKLCEDQGLWARFCAAAVPRIRPRYTTWADLTLHQQLLHLPRPNMPDDDVASFESNLEDLTLDVGGLDVIGAQGGLGGGGGVDSFSMAGGVRGMVWERSGYGLPSYTQHHPSSPSSSSSRRTPRISPRSKRPRPSDWPEPSARRKAPFQPVQSHLALPTTQPQVNYKHLYIVRDILARRLRGGGVGRAGQTISGPDTSAADKLRPSTYHVRPHTIDAISSIEAGGLPGHSETIYSLQLIARQMSITMTPTRPHSAAEEMADDAVSFWRGKSTAPKTSSGPVSGRDWLLSASRDHTLRLWQLSSPKPRVVKIYHGGHIGSVLCLSVTSVAPESSRPRRESGPAGSPSRSRRQSRPGSGEGKRLMAVSGGSDGRLCLWDMEHGDGKPEKMIEAHTDSVLCVRADDERVVSSSKDRTIKVFDVHTLKRLLTIDCNENEGWHRGAINAVCLTKDYILSASGDKTLRIWSIHTGALLAFIDAGTRGIASMDFSQPPPHAHPSLRGIIVIGSSDASIKVYHLISHIPGVDMVDALGIIPPLRDLSLRDMLLHQEDEMGSEGDGDGDEEESTTGWGSSFHGDIDPEAGVEDPTELSLELAGQCWASCACPGRPSTSDSALCTRCFNRGHTDLVRSVHLGEQVILSGSYDSTVKVWDRASGRLLRNLAGVHSGRIFSVVGDHLRIISSGLDARISIWDFSEGLDTAFVEP